MVQSFYISIIKLIKNYVLKRGVRLDTPEGFAIARIPAQQEVVIKGIELQDKSLQVVNVEPSISQISRGSTSFALQGPDQEIKNLGIFTLHTLPTRDVAVFRAFMGGFIPSEMIEIPATDINKTSFVINLSLDGDNLEKSIFDVSAGSSGN